MSELSPWFPIAAALYFLGAVLMYDVWTEGGRASNETVQEVAVCLLVMLSWPLIVVFFVLVKIYQILFKR